MERELARQQHQRAQAPAPSSNHWRPTTRGDCVDGPRPCPFVGCRYHIWLEATQFGAIVTQQDGKLQGMHNMRFTCVLDAAEQGPLPVKQIGRLLGVKKERLRQMERVATARLKKKTRHLKKELQ